MESSAISVPCFPDLAAAFLCIDQATKSSIEPHVWSVAKFGPVRLACGKRCCKTGVVSA
jgi:hypothetical protein